MAHEYNKNYSNNHISVLIFSFNLFIIIYFIFILTNDCRNEYYSNRLSAIKLFIIQSVACIIPYIIFLYLTDFPDLSVSLKIEIYSFLILSPLFFYLYKRKRFGYCLLACIIILTELILLESKEVGYNKMAELNQFHNGLSSLDPIFNDAHLSASYTFLCYNVSVSLFFFLLPWIVSFFYIKKYAEKEFKEIMISENEFGKLVEDSINNAIEFK